MDAPVRRRKGRRPIDPTGRQSVHVSVRTSELTYDEVYALAKAHGVEPATYIRQAIEARVLRDRRRFPR